MIPFFSGSISGGSPSEVNTPTSSFPSPDVFHSFTTLTSDAGYPVDPGEQGFLAVIPRAA